MDKKATVTDTTRFENCCNVYKNLVACFVMSKGEMKRDDMQYA